MQGKQQTLFEVAPIIVYQYLLIIRPVPRICRDVMELKSDFAARYGIAAPAKSQPHITVVAYQAQESFQDNLVQKIKKFTEAAHPVKIQLAGITGFPSHTIYVKVKKEGLALKHFWKNIETTFDPKFNPHLTIARQLDKETYTKALEHYSKIPFSDSFKVNSFILLKRPNENENYKHVFEFKFEGKPAQY